MPKLQRILIITPHNDLTDSKAFPLPPPILAHLAGLTRPDIEVVLINEAREPIDFNIEVDLICISVMSAMVERTKIISDRFRKLGKKVVVGGHHPTACPVESKEFADVVFIGEAENTYPKMIEDYEKDALRQFYMCGHYSSINPSSLPGSVFHIEKRPNLVNLPLPRRELLKSKYLFDVIHTVRGCPYACDFCAATEFFGRFVRHRPLNEVETEIAQLKNIFYLIDDNIFCTPEYNIEFYKLLIAQKRNFQWTGMGSLSVVNHPKADKLLQLAARSGLFMVQVGIESLESSILDDNNISAKIGHKKDTDLEFTKYAIKKIQSYGINVWAFFLFGFMNERPDVFEKVYQFVRETNVIPMMLTLNLLPGTRYYEKYKDYLIPVRGYDMMSGPLINYYLRNMRPNELECGAQNLRVRLYSIENMARRLFHAKPSSWLFMTIVQLKLRTIFREMTAKVNKYALPNDMNLLADEYKVRKSQNRIS